MKRTLSMCLLLACAGSVVLAQDISATIQGSILDPTNATVPRAKDLKINVAPQVGAVTETVEQRSRAGQVELGTAANATTIQGVHVRELTLITRNCDQGVSLMPGVSANTTGKSYQISRGSHE